MIRDKAKPPEQKTYKEKERAMKDDSGNAAALTHQKQHREYSVVSKTLSEHPGDIERREKQKELRQKRKIPPNRVTGTKVKRAMSEGNRANTDETIAQLTICGGDKRKEDLKKKKQNMMRTNHHTHRATRSKR